MNMLYSESEDHQNHTLGLYSTEFRRNSILSLSPFDNSESADDSFFYDPSSPAPAVRQKSKTIDEECINEGMT
jgi:hypothetical protein